MASSRSFHSACQGLRGSRSAAQSIWALVDLLTLVDVHRGGVHVAGELRRALAAVNERGERINAFDHGLAAVGERVLDGVVVEVLAAIVRSVCRRALAGGRHGPAVLDPTAFVDLVDQHFQQDAGGGPEEVHAVADLPGDMVRVGRRFRQEVAAETARGADQGNVAQFAGADLLDQCLPGDAVAALQPRGDLEILLLRCLARSQNAAATGRIGCEVFSMNTFTPFFTAYSICTGRQ